MEDQRGLLEIWKIVVAQSVLDQMVTEPSRALLAIVVHVEEAGLAPGFGFGGGGPASRKRESRRQQHQPGYYLGVLSRVESRQVAAHARPDERDRFAGGHFVDHIDLATN